MERFFFLFFSFSEMQFVSLGEEKEDYDFLCEYDDWAFE
jgi:hypothetical protein